jgi:hypothetical protein
MRVARGADNTARAAALAHARETQVSAACSDRRNRYGQLVAARQIRDCDAHPH